MALAPSPISGYAFTPEDSRKGAQVAKQRHDERIAATAARRAFVDKLTDACKQGDIGQVTLTAAMDIVHRLLNGLDDVPIESSLDVARLTQAAEVLYKVWRLETGQSTSNQLTASVDADLVAQRLAELQARTVDATSTVSPDETTTAPG